MFILAGFALKEYQGQSYVYILFSFVSYLLIYFGFRKNALFFDSFIGVFLWLGFWLKATVRIIFFDGVPLAPHAVEFKSTGTEYDQVLLISTCAFSGIFIASWLRQKYLFIYPDKVDEVCQPGLFNIYIKYRKLVLFLFVLIFVSVAAINLLLGIYQRGEISQTTLPYGLNGVLKWLLLFGLASFSAILLKFEYLVAKKTTFLVAFITLLESFFSSISLLSRGMILNFSSLGYGAVRELRLFKIKLKVRFFLGCFLGFIFLFGSSVLTVNYIRVLSSESSITEKPGMESNTEKLTKQVLSSESSITEKPGMESNTEKLTKQRNDLIYLTLQQSKMLFVMRWVGLEGVMSVSSYPNKGWDLWREAWQEKYSENITSFYDINLINSSYQYVKDRHYVNTPGIVGFLFYPGSYFFLFACMVLISLGASCLEIFIYKFGGKNLILCSLLAQVIAYRFASFGYVPAQSYLLFGAIFLNIVIIYIMEKILNIHSKPRK
jgi:hypothetical protein